jgi:hypothetical protein
MSLRKLNVKEIEILKKHECFADNWETISVKDGFNPENIRIVTFAGNVLLGKFTDKINFPGDLEKHSGIYNSYLQDCEIGDNCYINNVANLVRYNLEERVVIENCATVVTEGTTCFGNGIEIDVLNEGGGRSLPIFDLLSAQIAYMLVIFRHDQKLIKQLTRIIEAYVDTKKATRGSIGKGSKILNTGYIKNVFFGKSAFVQNAVRLEEGTLASTAAAPVHIGDGVIAKEFIIQSGSKVDGSALIDRCFIGQGVKIGKQYSAENSAFFANSEGFHGEACSIFAGPYTVTHHKSTLLIAGMFSFFNAGSGSNQSNHMYKLGPLHQGILERGSKTGSFSYMLWPSRIGVYSVVTGKHYSNFDTSEFPFSYITEEEGKSQLIPAMNLFTVGTRRDTGKWPSRDRRKDQVKYDLIHFDLFNPYTVGKILDGYNLLKSLAEKTPKKQEYVQHKGIRIKRLMLKTCSKYYDMAIRIYIGNELVKRLNGAKNNLKSLIDLQEKLFPSDIESIDKWIDLSGMLISENDLKRLTDQIGNNEIQTVDELTKHLKFYYDLYEERNWQWCCRLIENRMEIKPEELTGDKLIQLVKDWETSTIKFNNMILKDASKEFDQTSRIGYGIDGNNEAVDADFEAVRKSYESNSFVIDLQKETEDISKISKELIEYLKDLT